MAGGKAAQQSLRQTRRTVGDALDQHSIPRRPKRAPTPRPNGATGSGTGGTLRPLARTPVCPLPCKPLPQGTGAVWPSTREGGTIHLSTLFIAPTHLSSTLRAAI